MNEANEIPKQSTTQKTAEQDNLGVKSLNNKDGLDRVLNNETLAWADEEEKRLGVLSSVSKRAKRIGSALVLTTLLVAGGGMAGKAYAGERGTPKPRSETSEMDRTQNLLLEQLQRQSKQPYLGERRPHNEEYKKMQAQWFWENFLDKDGKGHPSRQGPFPNLEANAKLNAEYKRNNLVYTASNILGIDLPKDVTNQDVVAVYDSYLYPALDK